MRKAWEMHSPFPLKCPPSYPWLSVGQARESVTNYHLPLRGFWVVAMGENDGRCEDVTFGLQEHLFAIMTSIWAQAHADFPLFGGIMTASVLLLFALAIDALHHDLLLAFPVTLL